MPTIRTALCALLLLAACAEEPTDNQDGGQTDGSPTDGSPNDGGPNDGSPNDGGCPLGQRTLYWEHSCGSDNPEAWSCTPTNGAVDACIGVACSCTGETIDIGCGFSDVPFESYGACPGDDASGL